MNQLASKIQQVERDISEEKGPLYLCALLEPQDGLYDRWDLVISAPWATFNRATIDYLITVIRRHLTPDEQKRLDGIDILQPHEHPVRTIRERYDVEHGQVEVLDNVYMNLNVRRGYIITSRRTPESSSAPEIEPLRVS
jgi:hypothetical protein